LYETVVTRILAERLGGIEGGVEPEFVTLREADAADRIALHLASVVERAIDSLPEKERVTVGVQLARRLIEQIAADMTSMMSTVSHVLGPTCGRRREWNCSRLAPTRPSFGARVVVSCTWMTGSGWTPGGDGCGMTLHRYARL
jgi:hypothetical protein